MRTESSAFSLPKMQQIEEELNQLKIALKKYHLTSSSEQDYDIKSQIIDKQNEMIELLIEHSKKTNQ